MNRAEIASLIKEILRKRKRFTLLPKSVSEHIVFEIENPELGEHSYRTGSLIRYLKARRMKMVASNFSFGKVIVISDNSQVHYAIRCGMEFFNISENKLIDEGIDYHVTRDTSKSIGIDRFCELMDYFKYRITIEDESN
jgi:hypothetical protein